MDSEVRIYNRENGEIQRVQVVRWDDWSQLDFLYLMQNGFEQQVKALGCFYDIYKNYLVPACPWIFPQMLMFTLPEDVEVERFAKGCLSINGDLLYKSEKYGTVSTPLIIASIILQNGMKIKKGQPVFSDTKAEALYKELEKRGCVKIVCGKLPMTKIIPVGRSVGYLSEAVPDAKMKVNANFFIMDPIDCATIYDQVGTPFGLCVKDGVIENPPLFDREALLVNKDGSVSISQINVRDLYIKIKRQAYVHGKNAIFYTRLERAKTPDAKGLHVVIVGRRVVAVKRGGKVDIPASGFVMTVNKDCRIGPGDEVIYHGLKDVKFGIQVGNSIIRKGEKTDKFISRFYNIYHMERVPFPPSLYPMDFEKARAARIALGADKEGKPVLFWAEGKGKLGYVPGEDSTGASLSEMADIAADLGLRNAINLDGGGSAQILVDGVRALHISDRNKEDNSDAERLVPLGLVVR